MIVSSDSRDRTKDGEIHGIGPTSEQAAAL